MSVDLIGDSVSEQCNKTNNCLNTKSNECMSNFGTYFCCSPVQTSPAYNSIVYVAMQCLQCQHTFLAYRNLDLLNTRPSTDISVHNSSYRICILWQDIFHGLSMSLDTLYGVLCQYRHTTRIYMSWSIRRPDEATVRCNPRM